MVLEHVANDARVLVVPGPVSDADRLRHRDLDVVDVAVVPERLEDAVGETQDEDVLDRLLPEVVVDPVDLPLAEDGLQLRRSAALPESRSCPNGFSTTTRAQPVSGRARPFSRATCTIVGSASGGVAK